MVRSIAMTPSSLSLKMLRSQSTILYFKRILASLSFTFTTPESHSIGLSSFAIQAPKPVDLFWMANHTVR